MNDLLRGFRQRLLKLNLTQRLVLSLVVVVVAVFVFSSLPANLILWRQLEQQVWITVDEAQAATKSLFEHERVNIHRHVILVAERPTLYQLIQEGNLQKLEPYLETIKQSSEVDVLTVVTNDWWVGDRLEGMPQPQTFVSADDPHIADYINLTGPQRFFIFSVSQIPPNPEGGPVLGWLLMAQEMDDEQMLELSQQTGLVQSLIIGGQRSASSLADAPQIPFNPKSASLVENGQEACCTVVRSLGETYFVGLIPMTNSRGEIIAVNEVARPVDALRRDMRIAIFLSTGVSLVVILAGTLVLIRMARTITQPLEQLSQAAEQYSLGKLESQGLPESDIPEINQLAQHLDNARRQLRQMLALTQRDMKHAERLLAWVREGVVAIDDSRRITSFNRDAEQITGYQSKNVLHRHAAGIFPPASDERFSLAEMLDKPGDQAQSERLNVLDARGRPLLISANLSPAMPDPENGDHTERVLVFRGVTEEEAVSRLRYNFLANVAHEFRTPLSGIAATTDLLEEGSELTREELDGMVDTIRLCTLHMQTLVDNLLESTIIEAGIFQVQRQQIQFVDVAKQTAGMMQPLLKRRNQVLRLEVPSGLPVLWADPHRLTQVLVNLISNASHFSPMNGQILLTAGYDEHKLTVAVLDSGPSLPAGRYADLFNRFAASDCPAGDQYGIGLGLSVVKSIVEMHGGKVGAQERHAGGAQVWFTLPIQTEQESEVD